MNKKTEALHLDQKACLVAQKYKRMEIELLEVISQMDQSKAFYHIGYSSLFSYATGRLKLSEAVAYNFINVARKSHEVPELKKDIAQGKITISKAKKITSVITPENKKHWLNLAQSSSLKKLEKKVALAAPKQALREEMKYVARLDEIKEKISVLQKVPRVQIQMGVDEKTMLKFRRAQDLLSQRKGGSVDLEQTLNDVLDSFLQKNDPVRRAQRQKNRGKLSPEKSSTDTTSIAATTKSVGNTNTLNSKSATSSGSSKNDENKYENLVFSTEKIKASKPKSRAHGNAAKIEKKSVRNSQQVSIPVKKIGNPRKPLPARIKHQVQLRDGGRCTYVNTQGQRCSSQRYLQIHHRKPVAQGGQNQLDNLTLLCSGHHKVIHCR